jgi:hypothetical protein
MAPEPYDGASCPNCKGKYITASGMEWDGTYRECECNDCGATWHEIWQMIGYENLQVPEQPEKKSDPRPGEGLSEYLERMLGPPGSRQRQIGDPASVTHHENVWLAHQKQRVEADNGDDS